jgi:hypothetical protein
MVARSPSGERRPPTSGLVGSAASPASRRPLHDLAHLDSGQRQGEEEELMARVSLVAGASVFVALRNASGCRDGRLTVH